MLRKLLRVVLIITVIFLRYEATKPHYKDGDKIRISSTVTSEPVRYSNAQYVSLEGLKFYLPLYPEVNYGDSVVVEGVVEDSKLKKPKLTSLDQSSGLLPKLRKRIIDFYRYSLPEPHSSLIAGVTLGSKSSIPQNFWEQLKTTGTAHVVVASGMNVTLVAGFLISMLVIFIPRRKAVLVALAGIWMYALMSGFDAPIVRAAVMGSIAFSAQALGRVNYAWRGLFISAAAMLIIKPQWIVDYGFILSFVATVSLMLFEKRIAKYFSKVPQVFREGLTTSLAAQIGVSPILYATFGQFNILSPIINGLVLWTIAPITIIGMIAAVISLLSVQLGRMVLLLSYPLSFYYVSVIELFSF